MTIAESPASALGDLLLEFQDVSRVYGKGDTEVRALDRVSLSVRRGEFLTVMGASGSGKSTCLNLLGCLDLHVAVLGLQRQLRSADAEPPG